MDKRAPRRGVLMSHVHLKKICVTLSNLRNPHVALSNLRNFHLIHTIENLLYSCQSSIEQSHDFLRLLEVIHV